MQKPLIGSESEEKFYRLGGWAALGVILVGITEIGITFLPGGNAPQVTIEDWFTLFADNPLLGLRNLGLLNIFLNLLAIPFYLAMVFVHRGRKGEAPAILAFLLVVLGVSTFLATNRAFPMLALSRQLQAANSPAERSALKAAGQALLAVGESHTPGTFPGFILVETAGVLISWVMMRGSIFPKLAGLAGLVDFSFLLIFEVLLSFFSGMTTLAMGLAMLGGILSMLWNLLSARVLFQLARD